MGEIKYVLPDNISKETEKLARKKGFGWKGMDSDLLTQDCLQKWLREKHKIFLCTYKPGDCSNGYSTLIYSLEDRVCRGRCDNFNKYEDSVEEGLKIALNLIKIGKEKK